MNVDRHRVARHDGADRCHRRSDRSGLGVRSNVPTAEYPARPGPDWAPTPAWMRSVVVYPPMPVHSATNPGVRLLIFGTTNVDRTAVIRCEAGGVTLAPQLQARLIGAADGERLAGVPGKEGVVKPRRRQGPGVGSRHDRRCDQQQKGGDGQKGRSSSHLIVLKSGRGWRFVTLPAVLPYETALSP